MRTKVLASAGLLLSAPALAVDLDFDRNEACGPVVCAAGDQISQDYGDSTDLDVSYAARVSAGNSALLPGGVRYWDTGYSNFTDVAYAGDSRGSVIEITLTPRNGATLEFYWIYLGGVQGDNPTTSYRVFDLDYVPIYDSSLGTVGPVGLAVGFSGIITDRGYIIQVGPDGHDVGIDKLVYLVNSINPAVPEPASWAMLVAGFGLTGAALRRRRGAAIA